MELDLSGDDQRMRAAASAAVMRAGRACVPTTACGWSESRRRCVDPGTATAAAVSDISHSITHDVCDALWNGVSSLQQPLATSHCGAG